MTRTQGGVGGARREALADRRCRTPRAVAAADVHGARARQRRRAVGRGGHPRAACASTRPNDVRLVRGSHIVTRRLFDHDRCYFFQGTDGRIIFAIPYETDFTLIGTTDAGPSRPLRRSRSAPTPSIDYLCGFAIEYFEQPVTRGGHRLDLFRRPPALRRRRVEPQEATRDYVLKLDDGGGAPLAQRLRRQDHHLPPAGRRRAGEDRRGSSRRRAGPGPPGAPLPGGDFPVDGVAALVARAAGGASVPDRRWAPGWCAPTAPRRGRCCAARAMRPISAATSAPR